MIIAAMAAVVLLAAPAAAQNATVEKTKTLCAEKWPGSYRMQEHCRTGEAEAAGKLDVFDKRYGRDGEEGQILARCWAKWSDSRSSEMRFRMTQYCVENEYEAYKRLGN